MTNLGRLKIAILMMQKNETSLLPLFLRYHESLFGGASLFIFDNGSTDSGVIAELKAAERRGIRIDWGHAGPKNFEQKGTIFANLIQHLDQADPHDFYFPLDCDEFIACLTPDGVSLNREDIDRVLMPFKESPSTLRISHKYWANPLHRNRYKVSTLSPKCFFARGSCQFLDHGYHNAKSLSDDPDQTTAIIYYEFHYKTYHLHRLKSIEKLTPFLSDFRRRSLRHFLDRKYHNHHCAKDLLLSKYDYLAKFSTAKYPIVDASFLSKMKGLGMDDQLLFERIPPAGIRLWLVWLRLRRTLRNLLAGLQEHWDDGIHLSRRIVRRLISGR